MGSASRRPWIGALVLLLVAAPAAAQQSGDLTAGLDLERQGRYGDAAVRFERALAADRTNLAALFGLERVLRNVGELPRLLPYVDSTLAAQPGQDLVWGMRVRVLGELGRSDEMATTVRAWMQALPSSPDPYREWAFALAQQGNVGQARDILEQGQRRLGGTTLMQELAQLDVLVGDWVEAAAHWRAAARASENLAAPAGLSLGGAPMAQRSAVLHVLLEPPDPVAARIAADALVGWDRPGEAWPLLEHTLPEDPRTALVTLRRFVERVRARGGVAAARVAGHAWERLAGLQQGPTAVGARIEAARAFADAGDRADADRMLDQVVQDASGVPPSAQGAVGTLIGVMADAGRPADAERWLGVWSERMSADERSALAQRIAWAWVRDGKLERAEQALGSDSGLTTAAVRGWIALFRGDLKQAAARFREVGPLAGSRSEATQRTSVVALVERVRVGQLPPLGAAFLTLERGDTAGALDGLEQAAQRLPATGGRSDVLAFAGELAAAVRDRRAEALLTAALAADSSGPAAPAAEYALAGLLADAGRTGEALARLEHLILSQPNSAVVPLARRLRDRLRGAVPSS